jgi:hypothetical protein
MNHLIHQIIHHLIHQICKGCVGGGGGGPGGRERPRCLRRHCRPRGLGHMREIKTYFRRDIKGLVGEMRGSTEHDRNQEQQLECRTPPGATRGTVRYRRISVVRSGAPVD